MKRRLLIVVFLLLLSTLYVSAQEAIDVGDVEGVAVSDDGSHLLSWTAEGTVTVWEIASGEEVVSFDHEEELLGAAWKPDGRQVLTWSAESLRVWNAQNGNQLSAISPDDGVVWAIWSADGSKILNWSTNTLILWDAASGDELFTAESEGEIYDAFLSADGNTISWWTDDGMVSTANLSGEVVESGETETEPTGDLTAADLTPGKWEIKWGTKTIGCPADRTTTSLNRPFILVVDEEADVIMTEDVFTWSLFDFEYTRDQEGLYNFLRNQDGGGGVNLSFEYNLTLVSPTRIEGVSQVFWSDLSCADVVDFVMTLVDEEITCMAGTTQGANMRSGPGTSFSRPGTLAASTPADVIGQATGEDGFVWWQLADGWVREDVVQTVGDCESVPETQP